MRGEILITVYGAVGAQGSKRHVGGGRMIESSKKVKPWREAVKTAACEVMDQLYDHSLGSWTVKGPIEAQITFTLAKPKSAPKKRITWPDRTPDIDKCCRSTFDALTSAGVWEDDARVVSLLARKVYPNEGPDALHIPGCVIRIRSVTEEGWLKLQMENRER